MDEKKRNNIIREYEDGPLIPDFSKKGADFVDDLLRQFGLPPMTKEQREQFEENDTRK